MTSDIKLAALMYHSIYPRTNFYSTSTIVQHHWIDLVQELRQKGILK